MITSRGHSVDDQLSSNQTFYRHQLSFYGWNRPIYLEACAFVTSNLGYVRRALKVLRLLKRKQIMQK